MKATKDHPVIYPYFLALISLMLKSMKVCWLWPIPPQILGLFGFILTIITFLTTPIFKNENKICIITFVYVLIVLVGVIWGAPSNIVGYLFAVFIHPPVIISVLFLKDEYKNKLFEWFVVTLTIILFISIPTWLLYLRGVPFPHGSIYDVGDGFHFMYSYKFFVISYDSVGAAFPRFSSVFLEPGWIGTLSCFVLFGLQFNLKRIATYLCLFAILLSMSLSAVVNMIVCGLLWVVLNSRHKFFFLTGMLVFLAGIALFALSYNNGNNAINERIVERLVFDEDYGIAGNNRTNETLDYYLENTMGGSERWFGIADQVDSKFSESNDWYNHSSGIKKALLTYGIIGVGLLLLFFSLILVKYCCRKTFVFYVCFLMASFVRDLWQTDCYIILFISSLSFLYTSTIEKNLTNVEIVKK